MTQTKVSAILGEDGGRGHSENGALTVAQPRRDGASEPEALRRIMSRRCGRGACALLDRLAALFREFGLGLEAAGSSCKLTVNGRPTFKGTGKSAPISTTASLMSGRATVTTL